VVTWAKAPSLAASGTGPLLRLSARWAGSADAPPSQGCIWGAVADRTTPQPGGQDEAVVSLLFFVSVLRTMQVSPAYVKAGRPTPVARCKPGGRAVALSRQPPLRREQPLLGPSRPGRPPAKGGPGRWEWTVGCGRPGSPAKGPAHFHLSFTDNVFQAPRLYRLVSYHFLLSWV
jgi:hypothetical protein